jgi:hypothetical protein
VSRCRQWNKRKESGAAGWIYKFSWRIVLLQRWMHAATPGSITGRFDKPQCRRWLDEEAEFVAETGPASSDLLGSP